MAAPNQTLADPVDPGRVRVDTKQWSPEKHVLRAFRTAAALAGDGPIDARKALEGAVLVARDPATPEAFSSLASILALDELTEPSADSLPAADATEFDLSEPFERSLSSMPGKSRLWGRDYATAALLAEDPSVERLADHLGRTLAGVRDEWFRFLASSTLGRSSDRWPSVWQVAGVPLPPENLQQVFEDPALAAGLKDTDRGAHERAAALALRASMPLSPRLLFACLLATADLDNEMDSEARILRFVHAAQGGHPDKLTIEGLNQVLKADLELDIELGDVSGADLKKALKAPLDVGVVRDVLAVAQETRRRVRPRGRVLRTRHHLAPLIGRPGLVAADLERLGIDLTALRQDFFSFLEEQHLKDDRDAWREILSLADSEPIEETLRMRTRAAADVWTYEDLLGYGVYIGPIADPILRGHTKPPLTVGIQAPWGQGKTSLMRMIQARLDPDSKKSRERSDRQSIATTYRQLRQWLNKPKRRRRLDPETWQTDPNVDFKVEEGARKPRNPGLLIGEKRKLPTVWFNPLFYQDRDQVWAGMAHAILHQLAGQIKDPLDRERFWFLLQLGRLNEAAIRRDLAKSVVARLLPTLAVWLVAGVAVGIALFILLSGRNLPFFDAVDVSWVIGLLTSIGGPIVHYLGGLHKKLKLDERFDSYVREPDYESRLGLLHFVDTDIDHALDLLVGDYPLAVFVDDLDRCDPEIVADVILAINQFLSLPHRNVFFFLGMDMQLVASALERVKGPKDGEMTFSRSGKSFGWQFMEKFVQLPFIIPQLPEEEARSFMETLLSRPPQMPSVAPTGREPAPAAGGESGMAVEHGGAGLSGGEEAAGAGTKSAGEAPAPPVEAAETSAEELALAAQLRTEIEVAQDVEAGSVLGKRVRAEIKDPHERRRLEALLSSRIARLMEEPDSDEIQQIVEILINDLDLNPRAIKRHLSVASLLFAIFVARGLSGDREEDRSLVVRAAKLLIDWPEFVYWLQNQPRVRDAAGRRLRTVDRVESLVEEASTVDDWSLSVADVFGAKHPPVLDHPELYRRLREITLEPPGLAKMVDKQIF